MLFHLVSLPRSVEVVGVWHATISMEITNVMEYEAVAKQKLPKMVFDYYASGAEDQWTLKENREAFSRIL